MKALIVLSNIDHQCLTFVWPQDLSYYVGYRLLEHAPLEAAAPLPHETSPATLSPELPNGRWPTPHPANWPDSWQSRYSGSAGAEQLAFTTAADGSAEATLSDPDLDLTYTWRLLPEESGVRLWLSLKTFVPLPGAFIRQQCLRFGSGIGQDFRRTVARVPFLSELLMQLLGNANGTLTWVLQGGSWRPFPVPFTRYHTPAGRGLYADSAGEIDCGLIVRESASREQAPASYWQMVAPQASWKSWSAGLYWERSVAVSNRHPADCLHAAVDLGPLEPGGMRTIEGKFYWLEGTKDDLYAQWQADFGSG